MDEQQTEILQRFDESRNAYNSASGLIKKGRTDEAEALLRQALKLYPREIFMDEALDVDPTLRESFSLLFSNIRARIEQIEREKFAPRVDDSTMTSLQDIVERNLRAQMGGRRTPVIFGSASETERPVAEPPTVSAPIAARGSSAPAPPVVVPKLEDVVRLEDEPAPVKLDVSDIETSAPAPEPAKPVVEEVSAVPDLAGEDLDMPPAMPVIEEDADKQHGASSDASVADGQQDEEQPAPPKRDRDDILDEIFSQAQQGAAPEVTSDVPARQDEEPAPIDAPTPPVVEERIDEEIEPVNIVEPERPARDVIQPGPAVETYEPAAPDAGPPEIPPAAESGEGAGEELTEDILKDKKPRGLRGLSMKLPGFLGRKAGKKKEKGSEAVEAPQEAAAGDLDTAPAEAAAPPEEILPVEDAAPEAAPDAEAKPGKAKRGRGKRAPKAPRRAAAKPAARKAPARGKGARKRGRSAGDRVAAAVVNLFVLLMVCAGVFFAYLGLKPVVQLKMAYASASDVESAKDKKPSIVDRAVNIVWGVKGGEKPATSGLGAVNYLAQLTGGDAGRGLAVATVAADAATLSDQKKADEAFSLIGQAFAEKYGGPEIAGQQYKNLYNASVRAYKENNADAALKYYGQLVSLMQDENFPDPGQHFYCAARTAALAQWIYLTAAKKKADGGDAEGAFDALVKLQPTRGSLSEARGKAYDDLAAQVSGALTGVAEKALGTDAQKAKRLAEMALALMPDNADAKALAARAGRGK